MTLPAYLREVVVEVGADPSIVIRNLRVAFRIQVDVTDKPEPSMVYVYNLAEDTAKGLTNKWAYLRLRAGYKGNTHIVAEGEVREVSTTIVEQNRITSFMIGGSDSTKITTTFNQDYEGNANLRAIVTDIVTSMGLNIGTLTAIPSEVIPDFTFSGPARSALDILLKPRGISWYEDDGAIRFSSARQITESFPVYMISAGAGMIGSPSLTETGVRATVLLTNELAIGQVVDIQSITVQGRYKVVKLVHEGDSWDGIFATEIECVTLE